MCGRIRDRLAIPTRRSSDLGSSLRQCGEYGASFRRHVVIAAGGGHIEEGGLQKLACYDVRAACLRRGDDGTVERVERTKRSEEHTSELQSLAYLVCRLLLEK